MATSDLVLGVDAGGTGTRCVVATLDGKVAGRGQAAGANPRSIRAPVANLLAAVHGALGDIDPTRVVAGVFGLAGAGKAGRARAEQIANRVWHQAGLLGRPTVMGDLAVAFAAGTEVPSGTLLLAGTGAAAALIRDGEVVRRCDGYGWLVGDDGSGGWIGREAVRAALAALDARGDDTVLAQTVPQALLRVDEVRQHAADGGDSLGQGIVAAVHNGEPARLAALAPVVEDAAAHGDTVAGQIIAEAARLLLRSVTAVGAGAAYAPLVLAGSLLVQPTHLAKLVRAGIADRDPAQIVTARDGAAGAAALALRRVAADSDMDSNRLRTAHRALLRGDST